MQNEGKEKNNTIMVLIQAHTPKAWGGTVLITMLDLISYPSKGVLKWAEEVWTELCEWFISLEYIGIFFERKRKDEIENEDFLYWEQFYWPCGKIFTSREM